MVSEEFNDSFFSGGSFVSQECMCGRIHFCNPEISNGEYEDGEYDRLKELQLENPKKYLENESGLISHIEMGNNIVVLDCPCENDIWYENLIWSGRFQITDYFKKRLEKMEKQTWEFTSSMEDVDFNMDEKYTYEEFVNKIRYKKLKIILQ